MQRPTAWLCLVITVAFVSLAPALALVAQPPSQATAPEAGVARPGVPPAPVLPSETLGWQLTFAVVVNEVMKRLKASALIPWMKAGTARVNMLVAGLLAAIAAAGIHAEFDQAAGTLLVTGLTLSSLTHFFGEWLRQYALQHFMYHAVKESY